VILFGGSQEGLIFHSDVHFFNLDTYTWEPVCITNQGPEARIGASIVKIENKVYLYGGAVWDKETSSYTQNYHEMWRLNIGPQEWYWEQLPTLGEGPTGIPVNLTAVPIGHHILVEGLMTLPVSYVFDTLSYTWTKVLSSSANNANFSSAIVVDSAVYYLCGYRHHSHAKDVIKFSFSHINDYVCSGTVPEILRNKEKNRGDQEDENLEERLRKLIKNSDEEDDLDSELSGEEEEEEGGGDGVSGMEVEVELSGDAALVHDL